MSSSPQPALTIAEYLEIEARSEVRHEFLNGEMHALAGASLSHNRIVRNVVMSLSPQLAHRGCEAVSNDLRVRVVATGLYTYPDVVVLCGEPVFDPAAPSTLVNPAVLFEVLSTATAGYDRGEKAEHYRRLPSLSDYVLIAQDRPHVEHFSRREAGIWVLRDLEGLSESVDLPSVGSVLPLAAIYQAVDLSDPRP